VPQTRHQNIGLKVQEKQKIKHTLIGEARETGWKLRNVHSMYPNENLKHKTKKQKKINTLAHDMVTHLISDPVQNNHKACFAPGTVFRHIKNS
jgi:hypothetical protein